MARSNFRRAVGRVIAKSERSKGTWIPLFARQEGPCISTHMTPQDDCPNLGVLNLIPGLDLSALLAEPFAEAWDQSAEGFKVHRVDLELRITPFYDVADTAAQFASIFAQNIHLRAGLVKQRIQIDDSGAPNQLIWNPLNTNDNVSGQSTGDYLDGKWMQLWNHFFTSRRSVDQVFTAQGCCPDVHGGNGATVNAGTWAIAEGGINTSIETDCQPCGMAGKDITPAGFGPFFTSRAEEAAPWTLRYKRSYKRPLHFKESDQLDLFIGWEDVASQTAIGRKVQPTLGIIGTGRAYVSR